MFSKHMQIWSSPYLEQYRKFTFFLKFVSIDVQRTQTVLSIFHFSPSSDSYRKKKKVYEPINTCIKRVLKEVRSLIHFLF